jgi:hypothetical protein
VGVVVAILGVGGAGLAAVYEVGSYRQIGDSVSTPGTAPGSTSRATENLNLRDGKELLAIFAPCRLPQECRVLQAPCPRVAARPDPALARSLNAPTSVCCSFFEYLF